MGAPISGIFNGSGSATVSFTNFNLCPNGQAPSGGNSGSACTATTGNITLSGGTGSFSSLTSTYGDLSTILSLNSATEPVGVPVNVTNWLVFDPTVGTPPIMITLTEVMPGSFSTTDCTAAPAAGQTCTPMGSGFNLSNVTATTSSVATTFDIKATDGVAGDTAFGTVTFSQSLQVPYQTVLAALENGGLDNGNYSSTYSAAFTLTAVPEPMTFALTGIALLGLGVLGRRQRAVRK